MKPSDWTEADRAVRLDELGHEYADCGLSGAHCVTCNTGPYETLRECQDACLEREIEARLNPEAT